MSEIFLDGRGVKAREGKLKTRAENVKRVKEWLAKNKRGTPAECAEDLGLARSTIYSISKELKKAVAR